MRLSHYIPINLFFLRRGLCTVFLTCSILYLSAPLISIILFPQFSSNSYFSDSILVSYFLFTLFPVSLFLLTGFILKPTNKVDIYIEYSYRALFLFVFSSLLSFIFLRLQSYVDFGTAFLASYSDRTGITTNIWTNIATLFLTSSLNLMLLALSSCSFRKLPKSCQISYLILAAASLVLLSLTGSRTFLLMSSFLPLTLLLGRFKLLPSLLLFPLLLYLFSVLFALLREIGADQFLSDQASSFFSTFSVIDYFNPSAHEWFTNFRNYALLFNRTYSPFMADQFCIYPTLSALIAPVVKHHFFADCFSSIFGNGTEGLGFGITPELLYTFVIAGVFGAFVHVFFAVLLLFISLYYVFTLSSLKRPLYPPLFLSFIFLLTIGCFFIYRIDLTTLVRTTSNQFMVAVVLSFFIRLRISYGNNQSVT